LAQEGPGILNWALAGWQRLQARGRFKPPPAVQEASAHFQLANDLMAQFVADETQPHADGRVQSSTLYSAYLAWCRRNGHPGLSGVRAASDLRRLGFERKRINGKSFWCGLTLNPQAEEDGAPPMEPGVAAYARLLHYLREIIGASERHEEFDETTLPPDILDMLTLVGNDVLSPDAAIGALVESARSISKRESAPTDVSSVDPTL
jgi:hypothetical protein